MTVTPLICPVCESGALQPHRHSDTFQHQGKSLMVDDLEGYLCAECGADPVFEGAIPELWDGRAGERIVGHLETKTPEISRFLGIIIAMFYNEHNPPHFHARSFGQTGRICAQMFSIPLPRGNRSSSTASGC